MDVEISDDQRLRHGPERDTIFKNVFDRLNIFFKNILINGSARRQVQTEKG